MAMVWTGPAGAQEATVGTVDAATSGSSRALPATNDRPAPGMEQRAQYIPLQAASVMSWMCGEASVQLTLNKSREECYRAIYPGVSACTVELQDKAPSTQNHPTGTRMDVLSFRAALRQCLQQNYSQRLAARGQQAPALPAGQPDPIAAQAGGIVRSR